MLIVGGLIWVGLHAAHRTASGGDAVAAPGPTVAFTSGPLHLIKGARTVDGVSVGYPHTMAGAVSAATEYMTQMGSTLDPDRARALAQVVAAPNLPDAADYFAKGPINSRKWLGLPTSGPTPTGASIAFGAAAYQLRVPSTDAVVVLLLGYLTTTTATSPPASHVGVFPMAMLWTSGDWKVPDQSAVEHTDYSSLGARPGSADAAAEGWLELTP